MAPIIGVVGMVAAALTLAPVVGGLKLAGRPDESDRPQGENPRLTGPGRSFGEAFVERGRNRRDNLTADRVRILEGVWRWA
ncbi:MULTISPECIES: hypothetical protein [Halomonas]|uniref:Uncharacterized protein n=1 Tax=Halomonas ventosae TaxID=229007 RepID=A0A4V3BYZ9_9GAMM|nr:hypothetical protein [Halomonas ventosae]TDO04619.1 hypothetical protein DFO68_11437 [Halomonas ventosae]